VCERAGNVKTDPREKHFPAALRVVEFRAMNQLMIDIVRGSL
jgi:hypothetical protein